MTDITELAQRLKLEVHRAVSNFNPQMNIKTRDLKELVEALEKAQHEARVDWEAAASLNVESQELKRRIAELEDAEQKLCAANVTLDARAELAERQLAEMVSRTVTVKMPKLKMLEDYLAEVAVEERKAILLGVRMEFHRALNAEGIKWEAE
ncbi:hypothetical protein [Klebsiella michiganensis]|uniref:hypothetical protein n=1 Tax=Klebsiella michiganensis TaxID=1134687 RepID=UPI0039C0345F